MLAKFTTQTTGNIIGLLLSAKIISGVEFGGGLGVVILTSLALAALNLTIAPVLKLISFPIRVLTLNLFGLVIDMAMIWTADVLSPALDIHGIFPLFWTAIILITINTILWTILSPTRK